MNDGKYQNLHVRMKTEVKQQFTNILEEMGLNPSTAVNMFARLIIQEKALPFNVALKSDNQIIDEARKATFEIGKDAIKAGVADMSMENIDAVIALSRQENKEV